MRACSSIRLERFRGTQKEDERGPLSKQSYSIWYQVCPLSIIRNKYSQFFFLALQTCSENFFLVEHQVSVFIKVFLSLWTFISLFSFLLSFPPLLPVSLCLSFSLSPWVSSRQGVCIQYMIYQIPCLVKAWASKVRNSILWICSPPPPQRFCIKTVHPCSGGGAQK